MSDKIKVVLSGLFYPLAILRYFQAAFERREDVELFTVGPFTGSWIPWNFGMHLPDKYAKSPDFALPPPPNHSPPPPLSFIEAQMPWTPDLLVQVDAGWFIADRPKSYPNFIIGTDPHVLSYDAQRAIADKFFCMQAIYSKVGQDEYLPYAFDPVWHSPMPEIAKEFDVCLLGLKYEQRNYLMTALANHGLKVCYELGPVFDEARELYAKASIGVNWSSKKDLTARVFELMGMGLLAVVNRVPDLGRFFQEGKHLIAFDTQQEAINKILYYQAHPEQSRAIALAGNEAVQVHTWDTRVSQILEAFQR